MSRFRRPVARSQRGLNVVAQDRLAGVHVASEHGLDAFFEQGIVMAYLSDRFRRL
jgi:hypothetical protein